ncbi:MAG: hypothetical protein WDM76_10110 [Limisphaerales bacterium]
MTDAEFRLRDTASKKILLEVTMLKAIEARSAISLDSVLKQLNQLRGGQNSPAPVPIASPARPSAKAPVTPQETSAAPVALHETPPVSGDLATLWAQLIEAVGRVSPFTRSYLVDAHPVSFEKNILVIGFDPEFEDHLGLVDNARNHTLLQTKLAELGHANCQIKFVKAEAPVGRVRTSPAPVAAPQVAPIAAKPISPAPSTVVAAEKKSVSVPFNKETFKNDPLIQKALEIFKGSIVEVRS